LPLFAEIRYDLHGLPQKRQDTRASTHHPTPIFGFIYAVCFRLLSASPITKINPNDHDKLPCVVYEGVDECMHRIVGVMSKMIRKAPRQEGTRLECRHEFEWSCTVAHSQSECHTGNCSPRAWCSLIAQSRGRSWDDPNTSPW
jgi:hypothetical protein